MFYPKTFREVCNAMQTGAQVAFTQINGNIVLKPGKERIRGFIVAIKKNDECGRKWIVTVAIPYEGKMGGEEEQIELIDK